MWNVFGSKPTCPVEPEEQQWIDGRFAWLREQLGDDTPTTVEVILPTPEFLSGSFEGNPDDAQCDVDQGCRLYERRS